MATFEGPLDLLLQLIRKRKMDIGEIPLAEICSPYLEYLEFMREFDMDIAIEFLDIASTLILIKSRALLPKAEIPKEEESLDTEEQLRFKLIEYQRYRRISEYLGRRTILGRDTFCRPDLSGEDSSDELPVRFVELSVYELLMAYRGSIGKRAYRKPHTVSQEEYPIERKILELAELFATGRPMAFYHLYGSGIVGRSDVVIAFMAILELAKLRMVQLHQREAFGPIHCRPVDNFKRCGVACNLT